jgi:hypothetical protein
LTVPTAQIVARPTSGQSTKPKQRDPSTYYHKSPFFESTEDPAIQEQLRAAFSDRPDGVPDRDVCLVQEAESLKSLVIRGQGTTAESFRAIDLQRVQLSGGLDPLSRMEHSQTESKVRVLLLSRERKFMKAVPLSFGQAQRATRGYQVMAITPVTNKCYYYWNADRTVCYLGRMDGQISLKALSPKEMKEEEMTARPVQFTEDRLDEMDE